MAALTVQVFTLINVNFSVFEAFFSENISVTALQHLSFKYKLLINILIFHFCFDYDFSH